LRPEKTSCRRVQIIVSLRTACRRPLSMIYRRPVDENESVTQPVPDHSIKPTTPPDAANAPTLSPLSATTSTALPEVTHRPVSAPTPHRRITIRLPGRGMNESAASTERPQDERADN